MVLLTGKNKPATIVVRVGNNRPDLGTNPICNRFTGFIDEGKPLFLPCNPPMPGAFVSVHVETTSGSTQLSICEAFVYTDQVPIFFLNCCVKITIKLNANTIYIYISKRVIFIFLLKLFLGVAD